MNTIILYLFVGICFCLHYVIITKKFLNSPFHVFQNETLQIATFALKVNKNKLLAFL